MGASHLVNDVNGVLDLLALEERVQVVEQDPEVVLPVSVGDDDGRAVPGLAVRRPVMPAAHHQRVLALYLLHGEPRREGDVEGPVWKKRLRPRSLALGGGERGVWSESREAEDELSNK